MPQKIRVSLNHSGMRLDVYVSSVLENLSRSRAKILIEDGHITKNGGACKAKDIIKTGDIVCVDLPPPNAPSARPENIPLDIIFEDSDIIVVNKPVGMVVHPAHGHLGGTLVNALMAHCTDLSGIGGELRAGIVHRLDKGTSGVIVVAKNDFAHINLSNQFRARTVSKIYMAVVFGIMPATTGVFDKSIGRSKTDRKKMSTRTSAGRIALTKWRVIEIFDKAISLVQINLGTGRMHQIRVHFTEAGHPLVGDEVYGGKRRANQLLKGRIKDIVSAFERPALHAHTLEITHPRTGERLKFTARIPEDLQGLIGRLKQTS